MITFSDMADWIMMNRTGNAFLNYTKPEIVEEIMARIDYDLVWFYALSPHGMIDGIVTADQVDEDDKPIIYVRNAIIRSRRAMRAFLERYEETYNGIPMRYMHRSKEFTINPKRILTLQSYGRT